MKKESKSKTTKMSKKDEAKFYVSAETLILTGQWRWQSLDQSILAKIKNLKEHIMCIDAQKIEKLDISGAYFIYKIQQFFLKAAIKVTHTQRSLIDLVHKNYTNYDSRLQPLNTYEKVYQIGEQTTSYIKDSKNLIAFIGATVMSYLQVIRTPFATQWRLLLDIIIQTGVKAIPIVSLLCFLIGIVLCYQIGSQLKIYGANIFVVDLLGISLLREFAPLITAIIVAGRSASSYTAELGSMKVQQEVDALKTFGISPIKRLILPRIIGMMISLPLLIVIADIISCVGGMIMAKTSLGISFYDFLQRFSTAVSFNNYLTGLIKAPFFAIIIGAVGCYRGTVVKNNSLSIGQETTKSVVYAIFLIIVTDALFSILFSAIGI
ncbi:ABC transporter permease [Cysteiniphilum sp. QT6929]|uniref:MlaE family ABC transporter permease n=1 Tax=Cysteiniphilum sp. QT6929 TaxID=2975055 RepID=UPI0024B364FA|nr:ABC transporter permease [Cysteiniphilum sp. QT6929]WHN65718.1 ABC transporter permease [Cysteiniphilum sp. QT6929]